MFEKYKKSFQARLLTLVILPIVIISVALTVVSALKLKNEKETEVVGKLKATALAYRESIAKNAEGDYQVIDGDVYAGDLDIQYIELIFDDFYKHTGIYATLFIGDTRRITSVEKDGKKATGTKAKEEVIAAVLGRGEEFHSLNTDVAGNACVVYYVPLYKFDDTKDEFYDTSEVVGMVFAGVDRATFISDIQKAVANTILMAVILGIASIVVASFVTLKVNKAIKSATRVCSDLAAGDFTQPKAEEGAARADELGTMIRNVNSLRDSFDETILEVKNNIKVLVEHAEGLDQAAKESSRSMGDLTHAVDGIASGATSQAHEVESSAQEVGNIIATIGTINDSVEKTNQCADEMDKNSRKVVDDFKVLIDDTAKAISKLTDITNKMALVRDAVDTVTTAANDINNIASQTNLLSLNASIEAARAGEAGRGFAVVAGEISNLSDQSNEAAVKIRNIMSNLKDETDGAVSMVNEMAAMMDKQNETSQQSQESLKELIEAINLTKTMVGDVKENSDTVAKLCGSLNESISSLSAISQENAASAEETSATITQIAEVTHNVQEMGESLKEVSGKLDEITAHFKNN